MDGALTLTIAGALTFTTADAARTQLTALLDRSSARVVMLDLGELRFCDLTGLRVLLKAAARATAAARTVRVVAASAELDWLLTLTRTAPSLGYPPGAGRDSTDGSA